MPEKPRAHVRPTDRDLAELHICGLNQCPVEDLHFFINATQPAVARLLKDYVRARRAYQSGLAISRQSLRAAHLKLAQTNATMASLIGKSYLGYGQLTEGDDDEAFDVAAAAERVRAKVFALATGSAASEHSGQRPEASED